MFADQAIVAHHLAHHRAIFLLDKTLVIFQIGATSRERDVFLFTIGDQHFIDELPTVIGIEPQHWKGKERACPLEGSQDRLLASMQEGEAFGPSGGHIGEGQRVEVAPLDVYATMSRQIRFHKAGLGLIPLLEGADGNLLLEERSRSSRGETMLTKFALRGGDPRLLRSWRAVGCGTLL